MTEIIYYMIGNTSVSVLVANDSFWLRRKDIAVILGISEKMVSYLLNTYCGDKLNETYSMYYSVPNSVTNYFSTRKYKYFNYLAICEIKEPKVIGNINSFLSWIIMVQKEKDTYGFYCGTGEAYDDSYFTELLNEIKHIRESEKNAFDKIVNVFKKCIDYNAENNESQMTVAFLQNKVHYAIIGKTAAEIVAERINPDDHLLGLQTWRNSPDRLVQLSDFTVAKNYLSKEELFAAIEISDGYLRRLERMAIYKRPITMYRAMDLLDTYLVRHGYSVLYGKGTVSHLDVVEIADKIFNDKVKR